MSTKKTIAINNLKLGVFVIAGLLFLVLLLYMIGKNRSLFGSYFTLKAQFDNTQGLVPGNNVRFAGIEAGSVKRIKVLADTLIEVEMIVRNKMKPFIHQNAEVSIGTEGFVGNKVVNIAASKEPAPLVKDGDLLRGKKALSTESMLQVLSKTNNNLGLISEELVITIERINSSTALWRLLQDEELPADVKASLKQVYSATARINKATEDVAWMTARIRNGEGSLGAVIQDTALVYQLNQAVEKIAAVGQRADTLALQVMQLTQSVQMDIDNGHGVAHALLKDSAIVKKINNSLQHIEQGTASFDENMKALKSNFLLRGYFRRQAKAQKESDGKAVAEGHY
jgi:phospholipid/cholesterol/gamma-HCH transport system substrate-binding protein